MEHPERRHHHPFQVRPPLSYIVAYAHPGYSVDIAEIDEPCDHSVQFGGMCANCGKDMTEYVHYQYSFLRVV